jgi:hypothetical protein
MFSMVQFSLHALMLLLLEDDAEKFCLGNLLANLCF